MPSAATTLLALVGACGGGSNLPDPDRSGGDAVDVDGTWALVVRDLSGGALRFGCQITG